MSKPADSHVSQEDVAIDTRDRHVIQGTLFLNIRNSDPQMAAVFSGGAGISASYYHRFARYLASENIATLTYDYRGIGKSRTGTLRGFDASFEDWAEHDCTAAIDFLKKRLSVPTFGISHSIGALALGGSLNASNLQSIVMIAPHTGYVGDYRPAYVVPMALLWHGVMPILTSTFGYFPARRLGLGEDIPKNIALAWARRRREEPSNDLTDRTHELMRRVANLDLGALAITLSDDAFATTKGAKRVMSICNEMSFRHLILAPQQAGTSKLGHWGFFRTQTLWPNVTNYLRECNEMAYNNSAPRVAL